MTFKWNSFLPSTNCYRAFHYWLGLTSYFFFKVVWNLVIYMLDSSFSRTTIHTFFLQLIFSFFVLLSSFFSLDSFGFLLVSCMCLLSTSYHLYIFFSSDCERQKWILVGHIILSKSLHYIPWISPVSRHILVLCSFLLFCIYWIHFPFVCRLTLNISSELF